MAEKQFDYNFEYQESILKHQEAGTLATREKPVVHYISLGYPITVGQSATVKTIDHIDDSLNHAPYVNTSKVVTVYESGDFESTYTRYVLAK